MEERREFNVVERVSGSVSRGMSLCCLHQASIGEMRSENCFRCFWLSDLNRMEGFGVWFMIIGLVARVIWVDTG